MVPKLMAVWLSRSLCPITAESKESTKKRLPDAASIFEAETCDILAALKIVLKFVPLHKSVTIFSYCKFVLNKC